MFLISSEGDIGLAKNQLAPPFLPAFSVTCPGIAAIPKPAQTLRFPPWSLLFLLSPCHCQLSPNFGLGLCDLPWVPHLGWGDPEDPPNERPTLVQEGWDVYLNQDIPHGWKESLQPSS